MDTTSKTAERAGIVDSMSDSERERMEARSRAYTLAGTAIYSGQAKGETDVEFDERYRLMNRLLDRAIAVYPDPAPPTKFNTNYPNEEVMRP